MKKRLFMVLAGLFIAINAMLAQTNVRGTVVSSEDGEPVIGATIKVVGTKDGTVSDADGRFRIDLPKGKHILRVSYVGMETKEVIVRNENVKIALQPEANTIDEVMVVAYGKTKRSAFTGAASEIKADDISSHITSTATSALAGKVAGVTVTSSSGAPGSAPTIRVRGVGSINASQTPLYIVDGAPYEAGIANINPNDIESMSVLKDASAAAIYGARGANGVIIITTKKAKDGDANVTFDAKWGSNSRLIPQYDVIDNPGQYYETHYKALFNSQYYHGKSLADSYAYADRNLLDANNGGLGYLVYTVPNGEKLIGTNFKLNPNAKMGYSDGEYYYQPDDWYDETFHNSFRQEYNMSVSGSNNRMNYYASAGYLDDGGQVNNSRYQRYTGRINVDYQVKKWLKLTTNMSIAHVNSQTPSYDDDNWGGSGNVFYVTQSIAPIYPLYVRNADGSIKMESGRVQYDISTNTNQHRAAIVGNAVRDNEVNRSQTYRDVLTGQWGAVITPVDGLTLSGTLSLMSNNYRNNSLYSTFGSSSTVDGQAYVESDRYYTVNQTYTANYSRTIAEKHNFDILLGYEQFKNMQQEMNGSNDHLYNPYIGELGNAYGTSSKTVTSSTDNYMTEGFFGRLQYDYDGKYFFSASMRRDASSCFAPGHRWGTFGSVGLAWQMNKESFLADAEWIDLLKLKVSYGVQGNDGVNSWYAYADRYNASYNEDTGQYNITMKNKGNENLTWETNKAWNIGLDFSLFKNRLNGSIDFFHRTTTDMLYWMNVPASSGLSVSGYYDNIGELYNRGVEVTLDGSVIRNKNLKWDLNLNLTHYKNKITELDHEIKSTYYIYKVGGTVYQAYLKQYAGVDKDGCALYYCDKVYNTDENGNDLGKDAEGNQITRTVKETTTNADKATTYDCGTTLPKLQGGFGTSLSIYGIDLSAQFSFQLGGKFYDGGYQALMHNGQSAGQAMHKDLLNAWSEDNTNTNIPRLSTAAADDGLLTNSQTPLDFFLTSSNYLSLNNLTLGYTLPKTWIQNLELSNVRIYVAGENLFLLTKRKGMDPRFNMGVGSMTYGAGLTTSSYAAMRSITAGISVTF